MSYTLILVIVTVLISLSAFNNDELSNKLILWPRKMDSASEYYRLLSSGFVHADTLHLFFNMLALFMFGRHVENAFEDVGIGRILFVVMYLAGIIAASLPSFIKNRHNAYYRSLGASGGVAAVLFAFVYFAPWATISIWFIPVPGIIAAVAYLIYSAYASRQNRDNVNHDAHFYGAIFGFLFTLLFAPDHGRIFLDQLLHPHFF